ncbi:MAG: pyrroline-5-carboxylate reductase [Bacillota bacterium]
MQGEGALTFLGGSSMKSVGFIGAGAMAESLISGIIGAGFCKPEQIWVTNRSNAERLKQLRQKWGVNTVPGKAELLRNSHVVVVAVKPKDVAVALQEMRPYVRQNGGPDQLIISVAAGIPIASLERALPSGTPVIRAMPNTSCKVLESATAIARGAHAQDHHMEQAKQLFSCVGKVVEVEENLLDAVTGLSGSGPAYVYLLAEALIEAGLKLGLPQDVTLTLASQTLYGAAKMLRETGESPSTLRKQVTSPNGTTMAALKALEEAGFTSALINAVQKATARARELAQQFA